MAKNFPYFKFIATEWLTGDIVFEDLQIQGLFINICALYWQRDGKLSLEDIEKRYKHKELIDKINGRFFTLKDGFISILFLDEQLIAANHTSKINSENGKKGATAKRIKATAKRIKATAKPSLASDKQRKEEEEEEEEEEVKEEVKEEVEVEDLMSDNDFFEKFWNMYDKKVGNKQGCMKKFKRLKSEEVQKIFNTLPSFIASIKDKKFQPFPETYINQKRWNDEIVVKSQPKPILYTNPTENKW